MLLPSRLHYARPGGPQQQQPPAGAPAESVPESYMESPYTQSSRGWARDFLRDSFSHPQPSGQQPAGTAQPGPKAGQAPATGAALRRPSPQQQGPDTVWTAPGYAGVPAKLAHKAKPQQQPLPPLRITDAEINRVAGRVYRIIEERMRRDQRRLGL